MPQTNLLSYFSKPITTVAAPPARQDQPAATYATSNSKFGPRKEAIVQAALLQASSSRAQKPRYPSENHACHDNAAPTNNSSDVVDEPESQPQDGKKSGSSHQRIIKISHLPEATISHVREEHLSTIRQVTSTTLPVRYSDSFFTLTISDPLIQQLSRVILYESEPVGWIRCRTEPCSTAASAPIQIYIQALAILSPYRNLGLATLMLEEILSAASMLEPRPVCIYAHVWEKNEDALDWYAKRAFKRVVLLERYYMKLRPSGAWIVRKEIDDT